MTAIELLLQRQSCPYLTSPAPSVPDLDNILSAGMRVPDHGCLQPWHFTVIQDKGLARLSDLFVEAVNLEIDSDTSKNSDTAKAASDLDKKLTKTKKMPFRAPMVIVISTKYQKHEKVPKTEQLIAAGCATHAMQMAAFALGYGAVWRTGAFAYNTHVAAGLNIGSGNDVVGYLYVGTASKTATVKPEKPYKDNVSYW